MRVFAWFILFSATVLTELAAAMFQPATMVVVIALLLGLCLLGRLGCQRFPAGSVPVSIGVFAATLAVSPGLALLLWHVRLPLELLLLVICRNAMLAACVRSTPLGLRPASLLGVYVSMVASLVLDDPYRLLGLGALSAGACGWLIMSHWTGIARTSVQTSLPVSLVGVLVVGATLLALVIGTWVGSGRSLMALGGFLPSSGGIHQGSDRARGGVGDGPDQIAGSRDPRSTGFDDSDMFVNSDLPGLYDVFIETFGEPLSNQEFHRLIGLDKDQILVNSAHVDSDLRMGRRFSLVRKPQGSGVHAHTNRQADALLWVRGPMPMHLRLAVYDAFDGHVWQEAADVLHNPPLDNSDPDRWLNFVDPPGSRVLAQIVESNVRIGRFNSDVVPLAPHTLCFRMGRVNRPDFFRAGAPGILKMFNRTIPAGSIVECRSLMVDPFALQTAIFSRSTHPTVELSPAVAALRDQWCGQVPWGWEQIQALIEGLGRNARYDPNISMGEHDPIGRFLESDRAGPSYAFATTAAVMLRSLGYETRLVGGFYIDESSGLIGDGYRAVHATHAHCWVEVKLSDGTWITLEPTPGFAQSWGKTPWRTRLVALGWAVWESAVHHRWWLGATVSVLGGMLFLRAWLVDWILTLDWYARRHRPPRQRILSALAILERRARHAHRARPSWCTVGRWLSDLDELSADKATRFAALVEWAAYAPPGAPAPPGESEDVCRKVLTELTLRHLRRRLSRSGMCFIVPRSP